MPWIKQISETEATGKLATLYQKLGAGENRQVANILKVHSLHPDVLEAHLNLYRTIMFGESGLSRAQREMIAVVVSATNACHYWTEHHGAALRTVSGDEEIMQAVAKDYRSANITPEEKVMLYYAEKLTREPTSVKERDIVALRKAGFSERDVFDINQVVAYFNYVNRIADGLGVQLEDGGSM